ncbi:Coiled-coil domain-containing protein 81 [Larimichthys crocea]|uniref:Uncharacterized protein n=1 Tax=Larimichthys crocea TaxID=215358 RepID=A0ACD3R1G0_LARCR|nr:Coiled-coil domain-containing protein 81 [Larimichthys crocea]
MTDILRLVSEADRRTLPTLSQLSENDINCIWADVSAYIERQLTLQKRPGSSVSLLSGGLSRLHRPLTANPITLPTVCSPQTDNKSGDKDLCSLSPTPDRRNAGGETMMAMKCVKSPIDSKDRIEKWQFDMVDSEEEDLQRLPTTSIFPPDVAPKLEEPRVSVSCSGHTRAGQELCYLCMQRGQRNVPVYLREQQQAEEKAQEKLLLLKEQQRDKRYMDEEQAKMSEHREHAKQVAAFNLQMSEKKDRTYCPLFPTSFIFPARPLTPVRRIQQHRYMNELQSQIESRRQHEAQDQQNRLLMEHLDQVQLVQEIALQKAQQLQQKHERTKHYKKALDTQVGDKKCPHPPECQADNSGFNRCKTATSNAESRERAQKLFQINFSAATQRKKDELHSRQEQLEKEREILKHNKMEFISSRINRFEKRRDISKSLEDEWSRSARLKHQREEEERRFLRSAGQLLVDKLAQYKRCSQCKRRTTNCGETNIWKDSHYLSGSQYMI